jgi:arginyl-tRNA synthetase
MGPDLAYHRDKWDRGFRTAVDVLGADHAGYPPRIRSGLVALGLPREFLDVELVRLVKLVREGEQVKFSKRAGNIVTLDELLDEVGEDVARYFYVRSSHKTEMNFDLDLAIKHSDENPVFYVQYAHARIGSVLRKAGEERVAAALAAREELGATELHESERRLVKRLLDFPDEVAEATARRAPHRITAYALDLAQAFTAFYRDCLVVGAEPAALEAFRLRLSVVSKRTIAQSLGLLGVSAPEEM